MDKYHIGNNIFLNSGVVEYYVWICSFIACGLGF